MTLTVAPQYAQHSVSAAQQAAAASPTVQQIPLLMPTLTAARAGHYQ